MSWSQAHGSARAVVSEAKIKFISLSLLADSDLSDSELPESHNFWADRKTFMGAYPSVPSQLPHTLSPSGSKFQVSAHSSLHYVQDGITHDQIATVNNSNTGPITKL